MLASPFVLFIGQPAEHIDRAAYFPAGRTNPVINALLRFLVQECKRRLATLGTGRFLAPPQALHEGDFLHARLGIHQAILSNATV